MRGAIVRSRLAVPYSPSPLAHHNKNKGHDT
jgi:hypothetical protein